MEFYFQRWLTRWSHILRKEFPTCAPASWAWAWIKTIGDKFSDRNENWAHHQGSGADGRRRKKKCNFNTKNKPTQSSEKRANIIDLNYATTEENVNGGNGKESKSILLRVFPVLADAAAAAALSAYVERHFTSFRSIHYSAALSASLTHFAPWLRNQFYLLFLLLFLLLAAASPSYTFVVVFPMRSCSTCNSIQWMPMSACRLRRVHLLVSKNQWST